MTRSPNPTGTAADTRRQALTVASFAAVLASNIAANALPLNGLTTAAISDRFAVHVIPAGYVFSIWGLIYVGLGLFTAWQAWPRHRADATLRALGHLPALTGVLNTAWILLWHHEQFALTVPVMVGLLATLVAIHLRLHARRDALLGAAVLAVRVPWSVYLGWITVATIANVSQTLAWLGFTGFRVDPTVLAAAVLCLGAGIGAVFVRRFGDAAYGLVIAWAYTGVAVKEAGAPAVLTAAAAGAGIVGLLALRALVRGRAAAGGASAARVAPA